MRTTAEDMVAAVARGAARRLAPEFGNRVEAEVAGALYARDTGERHEYDPISVGILVVAIATLAWEVYSKRRERKEAREVLKRALRTEVRREFEMTPQSIRVTEVVIEEIVERADGSLLLRPRFVVPDGRLGRALRPDIRFAPYAVWRLPARAVNPGRAVVFVHWDAQKQPQGLIPPRHVGTRLDGGKRKQCRYAQSILTLL